MCSVALLSENVFDENGVSNAYTVLKVESGTRNTQVSFRQAVQHLKRAYRDFVVDALRARWAENAKDWGD
jgi:hypothetical protein